MKIADIPDKFPIPFASAAGGSYIRPIPEASQIGIEGGAASLTDGFPPLNFQPRGAGGIPPFGEDFNGILNQITQWNQWASAGGPNAWDSAFAADIGGYPAGAVVASTVIPGLFWRSTADDNTTNPDSNAAAGWAQQGRVRLTANQTFYVATTGSDTAGVGSSGAPWLTLQHAWNVLLAMYDLAGYVATIQVADGTYTGTFSAEGLLTGQAGPESVVVNGNVGTPDNVLFNIASGSVPAFTSSNGAYLTLQNFKVQAGYKCFYANRDGSISFQGINFGACPGAHLSATDRGHLHAIGAYKITGAGGAHIQVDSLAEIEIETQTITLTGTPAFTIFAGVSNLGVIFAISATFVGAATGSRYLGTGNSIINTGSGGANYFPGNSAGSVTTGAIYL